MGFNEIDLSNFPRRDGPPAITPPTKDLTGMLDNFPRDSAASRQRTTISDVINGIPDEALFAKSPEFQKMLISGMTTGEKKLSKNDVKTLDQAATQGIIPADWRYKSFETINQTVKEKSTLQRTIQQNMKQVQDVGLIILRDMGGTLAKAKVEKALGESGDVTPSGGKKGLDVKSDPFTIDLDDFRTLAQGTEAFLEAIGFEEGAGKRDRENFINLADPFDQLKFANADLAGKLKYFIGTGLGYVDQAFSTALRMPSQGVVDIIEGGKPDGPETAGEQGARIATNALGILKPLANWVTFLGLDTSNPIGSEGWDQAVYELNDDPLTHAVYLVGAVRPHVAAFEKAKAVEGKAQTPAEVRADKLKTEKGDVAQGQKIELTKEQLDFESKPVEKPLPVEKPKVPEVDVDAPVTTELKTVKRAKLIEEVQALNPARPAAEIAGLSRFELEYQASGGRIARYPKFRKSKAGPKRAGFLEGAEAEFMLTKGERGTKPNFPVEIGSRGEVLGVRDFKPVEVVEAPKGKAVELELETPEAPKPVKGKKRKTIDEVQEKPDIQTDLVSDVPPEVLEANDVAPKIKKKKIPPKTKITVENKPADVIADDGRFIDVVDEVGETKTVPRTKVGEGEFSAPIETEGYKAGREVLVPAEEIYLDVDRFQPREADFSGKTAESISQNLDAPGMDPLVLWRDPKNGKNYVIGGHSRHSGLTYRNTPEMPGRFYEGTEAEAIAYAHGRSNAGLDALTLRESFRSYHKVKETGKTQSELNDIYGKKNAKLYENMAHLDPGGKFLEQLSGGMKEGGFIKKWAKEVGEMRSHYGDKFTNFHENQVFDYLYNESKKNYDMPIEDFRRIIEAQMNDVTRVPGDPLSLRKGLKTRVEGGADTAPLVEEINRLKSEIDASIKIRDKVETIEEITAQNKIIDQNRKEIARLKGGIDELVEKQGDIFAEPAKSKPAKIDTGFEEMDVARNLAHQKSKVAVAEQAIETAREKGLTEKVKEFEKDLATEKAVEAEMQVEFDNVRSLYEETGTLDGIRKDAADARADNLKMAEEASRTTEFGGMSNLPRAIKNWTKIGLEKMADGALRLDKWSEKMIEEYGDAKGLAKFKATLPKIYRKAYAKIIGHSAKFKALRAEAESDFLGIVRHRKMRVNRINERTSKWEEDYTEIERNDAGAIVEGVDNFVEGRPADSNAKTRALAKEYSKFQEMERQDINSYLKDFNKDEYIAFLENYLPHLYRSKMGQSVRNIIHDKLINSPNARLRKFPTLQDAVNADLVPLTQDVAYLARTWGEMNWRVAANKKIVDLLKRSKDENGFPAMDTESHGPGWERFDHPALRKAYGKQLPPTFAVVKEAGGKAAKVFDSNAEALSYIEARQGKGFRVEKRKGGVMVHSTGTWISPEYKRIAHMAFDEPLANRGKITRTYDLVNSAAKEAALTLSGFHFGTLFESAAASLGAPVEIMKIITGKGSFLEGKKLQRAHPEIVEQAILSGLQMGERARGDYGYGIIDRYMRSVEAATRDLPFGMGQPFKFMRKGHQAINRALWETVHEGYKIYSFEKIRGDLLKDLPDATPAQVKSVGEIVARQLNDAFGGQEWESHLWLTPKYLQAARRVMLAPDWTYSNIRVAGLKMETIKSPKTRKLMRKYWANMALALGASTIAMNYATVGHGPWDNEFGHEFDIDVTPIIKASKLAMSKIPGAEPYDIDADEERHYVKLGKQAREVLRWFQDPGEIAGHKMGPAAKQLWEQTAGETFANGWEMEWKREDLDFFDEASARTKHALSTFVPFSFGDNQFAFTFPMYRGMSPYKGTISYMEALESPEHTVFGEPVVKEEAIRAISDALTLNGHDGEKQFKLALGKVRHKYYNEFHEAFQSEDWDRSEAAAQRLLDLGATWQNLNQSLAGKGSTPREIRDSYRLWRKQNRIWKSDMYETIIGREAVREASQKERDKLREQFNSKRLNP